MRQMARKQKYIKKKFESTGTSSDVSANIYQSMMESDAFASLSAPQVRLYLFCKLQYYSQKTKPNDDNTCFYFNQSKWKSQYKLYSNNNSFYKDMRALIEKGFIKKIESGKNTRTRSIYQFSNEWQNYKQS
jgi:hypothetical protein